MANFAPVPVCPAAQSTLTVGRASDANRKSSKTLRFFPSFDLILGPEDGTIHQFFKIALPNEALDRNAKPWNLEANPISFVGHGEDAACIAFDAPYHCTEHGLGHHEARLDAKMYEDTTCESNLLTCVSQSKKVLKSHFSLSNFDTSDIGSLEVPPVGLRRPACTALRRNFESPLIGFVGRDIVTMTLMMKTMEIHVDPWPQCFQLLPLTWQREQEDLVWIRKVLILTCLSEAGFWIT
eukprot:s495_g14.t1